ncbi:predicted protein [Naegleria gruberi]|uniref:Predicted protein n=1 Tax=Naegleria gruberi TaxID=5762 RepID=D2VDL3_NAEGR|nr:uncharacterized protein NAEGRDRAFT_48687 [Naegleria gruberi]EFC44919.1 predicted protein [Naegleria gruberi]|eukprot:XP_002677663.1 predicted protein [Naegleria gruberi strain NEG-M]
MMKSISNNKSKREQQQRSMSKSLSSSTISTLHQQPEKTTPKRRKSQNTSQAPVLVAASLDDFSLASSTLQKNVQDSILTTTPSTVPTPLVQVSLFSILNKSGSSAPKLPTIFNDDEDEQEVEESESIISFRNNEEISQQPSRPELSAAENTSLSEQQYSSPQIMFKELTREKLFSQKTSPKRPLVIKSCAHPKDSTFSTVNLMLEKVLKIIGNSKKGTFLFLTRSNMDSRIIKDILLQQVPDQMKDIKVMSFHTFSSTILKKAGKPYGNSGFKIISNEDTRFCLSKVLEHNDKTNSLKELSMDVEGIQNFIEALKLEMKTPDMLLREIISQHQRDSVNGERRKLMLLQNIYSEYENLKMQSKSLDFTDLLLQCHTLLTNPSSETLSNIGLSNRSDLYILIDDFELLDLPQHTLCKDIIYLMSQTQQTSIKSVLLGTQKLDCDNLANLKQTFMDPFSFDIFNFDSIEDQMKETKIAAHHIPIESTNIFDDLKSGELVWRYISIEGKILDEKTLHTVVSRFAVKGFEKNENETISDIPTETIQISPETSELIFQSDSLSTPIGAADYLTAPQKVCNIYLEFSSKKEQMEWLASIERGIMLQQKPLKMPPCFKDKCQKLDVTKDQKTTFQPKIRINREKIRDMVYYRHSISEQFLMKLEHVINIIEQHINKSAKAAIGDDVPLKNLVMSRIFKQLGQETPDQIIIVDLKLEDFCQEWEKDWKNSLLWGEKVTEPSTSEKLMKSIAETLSKLGQECEETTTPIVLEESLEEKIEQTSMIEEQPKEEFNNMEEEEDQIISDIVSPNFKTPNNVSSLDALISSANTENPMTIEQLASSVIDEEIYVSPDRQPSRDSTPPKSTEKTPNQTTITLEPISTNYSNYDARSILDHFRKTLSTQKIEPTKTLVPQDNKKQLIEIDYEMNRLLNATQEHVMLDDSAYAFDSSKPQLDITFNNQSALNMTDISQKPLFTPTKPSSNLAKLRELTSPNSPSTVFSSIVSKSLSKKLTSPPPKTSPSITPSRAERRNAKLVQVKSGSPSKIIQVIKTLKTGVTIYKHSSSGTSKKKLVHLFLSADENFVCYVKPESRNIVPLYEIKSKFPVSSIRYLQKGELVKKRRLLEIKGGIASTLLGIKKEEMKVDSTVLFSFCLPERYLDFEAKSIIECQTWFDMWEYFVAAIAKNQAEKQVEEPSVSQ